MFELLPPKGLGDLGAADGLRTLRDSRPKRVSSGACQEVVLRGRARSRRAADHDAVAGGRRPVHHAAVWSRAIRHGGRNVGMYRLQEFDAAHAAMHWQIHEDGGANFREADGRLEVAVALGPTRSAYAATAPLPPHRRVRVRRLPARRGGGVVPWRTVDLEVPADAEIVLEGYVERGELAEEGPFGDHTGYYSPADPFPVFHVTAITLAATRSTRRRRRRRRPEDA